MAAQDTSDATLSALTISEGTLAPEFDSATTSYTASVAHEVAFLTVKATRSNTNAGLRISPDDSNDGTAGHQVALAVPVL
ncbi:MAG: cadherin-like beta sandwich domain-containing protein [Gemmatimonadetes bacterium]|nr:cadherin-like beta sandwich domain-containing protein [Gemmatimonadota bacterium]